MKISLLVAHLIAIQKLFFLPCLCFQTFLKQSFVVIRKHLCIVKSLMAFKLVYILK